MEEVKPEIYFHQGITLIWYIPNEELGEIHKNNYYQFIWHREDGPAYICESVGEYNYWINDKLHRYDGPAQITENEEVWWIRDKIVDPNEYKEWLIDNGMDINNLSDNDKIIIDLKWSRK